jgi:hypothetical protein
MKTQLRKQIRAAAGVTMRQVQAEAKRKKSSDDTSPLIATGLAARPPEGLDEVRAQAAIAKAIQRGEEVTLPESTSVPSKQPTPRPQTVDEVREALRGSNVLIYERHCEESQTSADEATLSSPDRQELVDELAEGYAARLRRILSRSGRKPFRLAGLRLYADLLNLLDSLEVSLTHLPDEPRLTCFANAIRNGLLAFEDDYTWIAEGTVLYGQYRATPGCWTSATSWMSPCRSRGPNRWTRISRPPCARGWRLTWNGCAIALTSMID